MPRKIGRVQLAYNWEDQQFYDDFCQFSDDEEDSYQEQQNIEEGGIKRQSQQNPQIKTQISKNQTKTNHKKQSPYKNLSSAPQNQKQSWQKQKPKGIIKDWDMFFSELKNMSRSGRPGKYRRKINNEKELRKLIGLSAIQFQCQLSEHHIIPGKLINQMLQLCCQQENRIRSRRIIQQYLKKNQNLKEIIRKGFEDDNGVQMFYRVVYWKQENLLYGPEERWREFKAKDKIDVELLVFQSQKYQKQVDGVLCHLRSNDIRCFEEFLSMKSPHCWVFWILNQNNQLKAHRQILKQSFHDL